MIQITQQKKPSPEDHQDLSSSSPLWELMQRCWSTLPADRPSIEEVRSSVGSRRCFLLLFYLSSDTEHFIRAVARTHGQRQTFGIVRLHWLAMRLRFPPGWATMVTSKRG